MGNNNPVVHAFLFAILNLAALVIERRSWPPVLLLALLLGGYDIVYETHFVITTVALCLLAVALLIPQLSRLVERGAAIRLVVSVALSLLVMFTAGGPTSNLLLSKLLGESQGNPTSVYDWAAAGVQQRVAIAFPKEPYLSLTHVSGRPLALYSWEFLGAQGAGFLFLPLSMLVLGLKKRLMGVLCALIALGAIVAPATIDFGRFNPDNFRLIFFSGLMAAVCFGMLLGEGYAWLMTTFEGTRVVSASLRLIGMVLLFAILFASSTRFIHKYTDAQRTALTSPSSFRLTEAERQAYYCAEYGAADAEALTYLATTARRGERLAANYVAPYQRTGSDIVSNSMILMAGARMPMVGFDVRIPRDARKLRTSVEGWSAQARAFWQTGDSDILRDLGADWLYVVPKWLSPVVAARIAREQSISEAFRSADRGRVIYRVYRNLLPARPTPAKELLAGLTVVRASRLDEGDLEQFLMLPLLIRNKGKNRIAEHVYIYYRIYDRTGAAFYDEHDAVGSVRPLDLSPGAEQLVMMPFVFPYNDGDYEVTFFARAHEEDVRLGSLQFTLRPAAAVNSGRTG
jgi:hypothetical protein